MGAANAPGSPGPPVPPPAWGQPKQYSLRSGPSGRLRPSSGGCLPGRNSLQPASVTAERQPCERYWSSFGSSSRITRGGNRSRFPPGRGGRCPSRWWCSPHCRPWSSPFSGRSSPSPRLRAAGPSAAGAGRPGEGRPPPGTPGRDKPSAGAAPAVPAERAGRAQPEARHRAAQRRSRTASRRCAPTGPVRGAWLRPGGDPRARAARAPARAASWGPRRSRRCPSDRSAEQSARVRGYREPVTGGGPGRIRTRDTRVKSPLL